jgi:sulfur-oxidizing protein SoxY
MQLTRRRAVALGLGGAAIALLPLRANAAVEDMIADFTGGTAPTEGDLVLIAPEIAENGNAVGIEVSCPGADEIRLLAPANPNPEVCTFHFGPLSGAQDASIRIRMAETQEIIALAKMPDGSFRQATALVRVTIGGCGG